MQKRTYWKPVALASLALNLVWMAPALRAGSDQSQAHQETLQYLLHYMQTLYVDEIPEEKLLEGAVRGLLAASGDPYTRYLNPDEHREFLSVEEGRKIGIGVEAAWVDGAPTVIAPIGGGPAERAGVLPGDRIVSIDGRKTEGLSFEEALKLVTGEKGSVVELGIERPGLPDALTFRIVRDEFALEYVHTRWFETERIGYVRLLHFFGEESGTLEKIRTALEDYRARGARGVILDLRNNPGGRLEMAGRLASFFLEPGQEVVSARGRTPEFNRRILAEGAGPALPASTPVVVLINEGSASASEIVAGALQDQERARLIGARSFGKASVQRIIRPLPGDAAALLTIQRYYTPRGRAIHGVGLAPDIAVEALRFTPAETLALRELDEQRFFESFKAAHPEYSEALVDRFVAAAAEKGQRLRPVAARLALLDRYRLRNPAAIDPSLDPQLARALRELAAP